MSAEEWGELIQVNRGVIHWPSAIGGGTGGC